MLSISGDGKVLVWQMTPGSRDLKLVGGFILQTDSVPRSMRLSKARGDAEMGGDIFKLLGFLRLLGVLSVLYVLLKLNQ